MAASEKDLSSWNGFQWRRKMEAFGDRDESVVAVGATGDIEGIWQVHRLPRRIGNCEDLIADWIYASRLLQPTW